MSASIIFGSAFALVIGIGIFIKDTKPSLKDLIAGGLMPVWAITWVVTAAIAASVRGKTGGKTVSPIRADLYWGCCDATL